MSDNIEIGDEIIIVDFDKLLNGRRCIYNGICVHGHTEFILLNPNNIKHYGGNRYSGDNPKYKGKTVLWFSDFSYTKLLRKAKDIKQ